MALADSPVFFTCILVLVLVLLLLLLVVVVVAAAAAAGKIVTTDRIEWSPDFDAWPMPMTLHIADLIRFKFSM